MIRNDEPDMPEQGPYEGELVEATETAMTRVGPGSNDLDSSLAVALSEAEINQQIATAKAYPRQIQQKLDNILQLATLDAATAAECMYSLPRGKDDNGKAKVIVGPSIRLAELIAQQWGNNRVAARVIAVDRKEKFVEAEGIYHDLETNSAVAARVRRRISNKRGALLTEDMIIVTGNAAASIALRNAILRGVPKPIWRKAYVAVEAVVRGDLKTLAARRVDMMLRFREDLGIKPEQLYTILQVKGENDIGLDEMVVATGFYSAIRNNEVTVEDLIQQAAPLTVSKTLGAAFGNAAPAKTATAAETGPVVAEGDHKLKTKTAAPAPAKAAAKADPAPAADPFDAIDAQTPPHDPATGEVHEEPPADEPTPDPEPEAFKKGKAPAGKSYLIAGEEFDANGRRPLYKDGVQFSTISSIGIGKHPVYEAHAAKVAPPPEPEPDPAPAEDEPEAGADADAGESQSPDSSDDSSASTTETAAGDEPQIRSSPEDRVDAEQQEEEPDDNPVDETPPPSEEQLAARPPEFAAFETAVDDATTWQAAIRPAWTALRKSPAYQAATPEIQNDAKAYAYNAAIKLHMSGADPASPANDPQLFLLFLVVAQKHEVRPVFQKLIREPSYKALNDAARDQIAEAVQTAIGAD